MNAWFRDAAGVVAAIAAAVLAFALLSLALLWLRKRSRQLKRKEARRRYEAERQRERAQKAELDASRARQKRFAEEQRRLMTNSLRYDVLRRDGFRCQLCDATARDGAKLQVDHIFPVSRGGKTEMSNLRTLCERCNQGKGAKLETITAPPDDPYDQY